MVIQMANVFQFFQMLHIKHPS